PPAPPAPAPRTGRGPRGGGAHPRGGGAHVRPRPAGGEPVDALLPPPLGRDEAAVAQAGEVGADSWLGLADRSDELADGALAVLEQHAGRVSTREQRPSH